MKKVRLPIELTEDRKRLREMFGIFAASLSLVAGYLLAFDWNRVPYGRYVQYPAVGLAAISAVSAAISALRFFPDRPIPWHNHSYRSLSEREMESLQLKISEYAGGMVVPLDRKMEIYKRNSNCFIAIVREDTTEHTSSIVGYLVLYPLLSAACNERLMLSGQGAHFKASDIAKAKGAARGCYISFVWGLDAFAQAYLRQILRVLLGSIPKQKGEFLVVTRPTTKRALEIVKEEGFVRMPDGADPSIGDLCRKNMANATA